MEWLAAACACFGMLFIGGGCFAAGVECARRWSWRDGFDAGKAAWQGNEDATKRQRESLDKREKAQQDWFNRLETWHQSLEEREAFITQMEKPPCVPSFYEQLVAPCMN